MKNMKVKELIELLEECEEMEKYIVDIVAMI